MQIQIRWLLGLVAVFAVRQSLHTEVFSRVTLTSNKTASPLYGLRSPGSSVGSVQADASSGPRLEPRSRRNLLNYKWGSIAHSLSLSSTHRPDMTEILSKRTQTHKSSIHPLLAQAFAFLSINFPCLSCA